MADIRLRQIRSINGISPRQRRTLRSLKLGRIGRESAHSDSPQFRGMLRVVEHLVTVDEDKGGSTKTEEKGES